MERNMGLTGVCHFSLNPQPAYAEAQGVPGAVACMPLP